jgi:hypothetical protein
MCFKRICLHLHYIHIKISRIMASIKIKCKYTLNSALNRILNKFRNMYICISDHISAKDYSIIQIDSKSIDWGNSFLLEFCRYNNIYLSLVRFQLVIILVNKFMVNCVSNQKPITKNTQNRLGLTKN